jgi:hypothetical protein
MRGFGPVGVPDSSVDRGVKALGRHAGTHPNRENSPAAIDCQPRSLC